MVLVGCDNPSDGDDDGTGSWYGTVLGSDAEVVINDDGTWELNIDGDSYASGTYTISGDSASLNLNSAASELSGYEIAGTYSLSR
jgi:hypothetical protein